MRASYPITAFVTVAVAAAFVMMAVAIALAVRSHSIAACEERGGQAVTSPWYSEEFSEVQCIEP